LTQHLRPGVSGQGEKAVVGKNDRIVRPFRIGKHHGHAGGLSGNDERSLLVLEALNFGFGLRLFY
jgi:hypothetical protein